MGPRGEINRGLRDIESFLYWICVMRSGSYACFRGANIRTRPQLGSDWVLKRRTEMVFGTRFWNENSGRMLVSNSIELRGSGLRSVLSHWTPLHPLVFSVACGAPMPCAAGSSMEKFLVRALTFCFSICLYEIFWNPISYWKVHFRDLLLISFLHLLYFFKIQIIN